MQAVGHNQISVQVLTKPLNGLKTVGRKRSYFTPEGKGVSIHGIVELVEIPNNKSQITKKYQ